MFDMLFDPTFQSVCLGTAMIGAVSGSLGCFAYLRKQSLIGDVVSHSSLFGIVLFFLASYWITGEGSKSLIVLIPGALFAGTAALMLTRLLVNHRIVRDDSGLGVMLAVFFGTGIMLLRWIQRVEPAISGRRGLQDYLFGMAASLTSIDLIIVAVLGGSSILVMVLYWNQLKAFTFDPQFSSSMGLNIKWLDTVLILLLVTGVVIGIQSVGVVLMIALLVTPAAAARQWTHSLGAMVALAGATGAICGAVGSLVSSSFAHMPTGPVITLTATTAFAFSIVCAPKRGVVARHLRQRKLASQSLASSMPSGVSR